MEKVKSIFIFILLLSCAKKAQYTHGLDKYVEEVESLEVSWGPVNFDNVRDIYETSEVIFPTSIEAFGYSGAFVFVKPHEKLFDSLYYSAKANSISIMSIYDCCNLYITDTLCKDTESCDLPLRPVPDIVKEVPFERNGYQFGENSFFLLLDSGEGDYLKSRPTFFKGVRNVDSAGYSKGLIVDETQKLIVYWILIW